MKTSEMIEVLIKMAMSDEDKKRVDLTTRPYPSPWFKNYDYGEPQDDNPPDDGTPRPSLYSGRMDRYDSTREFIEKDRERRRKNRKNKLQHINEKARATSGGEK